MRLKATARVKAARVKAGTALVTVVALAAAGLGACSGEEEKPPGAAKVARTLGPGEGMLNLVALPGSIENGGADPRVDWVTPFQERTGCKVGLKIVQTTEEMARVMRDPGRRYDGVAAPPEVAGGLVEDGQIVPVNTDLVDGYKKLEPRLRKLLERNDEQYGIPYVWGTNLLMYDTRTVPPPSSWAALFDPAQARRYPEKLVMRASPLAIAEAALYLKGRDRELKIRDPYALTPEQLAAAGKVLAEQRPHVGEYWELPADAVSAFAGDRAVLGQVWPYQVDVLTRAARPVRGVAPAEGVTGWMDAWMISTRAQHPNCMYQWLQWTASPDVQQQVAEWNGVAPANPQACSGDRLRAGFCAAYHVGDRDHLGRVIFAHTPTKACDPRAKKKSKRECTDYAEWTRIWVDATGA